jgi:ABC-type lipoprotein release transport system permease subunit
VIFSAVVFGLFTISVIACLVPTIRAMRIDPAIALRYE